MRIRNFLSVLILVTALHVSEALIGSIVGARILFRLHDDFENNNKIVFTVRTVFDKSDGMGDGSGIVFRFLDYPRGPALDYADKFGILKVSVDSQAAIPSTFPNNFTVVYMDGDLIEGEMEAEFVMPQGRKQLQRENHLSLVGVST